MTNSLPAPRLAAAYEVLEVVRRGGLSTTFRARHHGSGDLRCIDVLRPAPGDRESLERRLDAEARPLMELRHPHLARLVDAAVGEGGEACIVREDHQGVSLRRLCGSRRPSVSLAVHLLRQASDALAHLHERGRVVGDVSPEGLLLGRSPDDAPELVVADLGLAKDWQEEAALTAAGLFVGRLRYASPEQFEASGRTSATGDVYGLGLVAYELLTGTHPVTGDTASSLIAGHLFRPPVDFAESDPAGRVPEPLRRLVLAALAKDPGERPAAASFRDQLAEIESTLPAFEPTEIDVWVDPRRPAASAAAVADGSEDESGEGAQQEAQREATAGADSSATSGAREDRSEDAADLQAGIPTGTQTVKLPVGREPAVDPAQLEAWLDEARDLARDEKFEAARDKVRQVLKVQPDHSVGLMLLASLEACLKIQVEESKAHQTVSLSAEAAESAAHVTRRITPADLPPGPDDAESTVRLELPEEWDDGKTRPLSPEMLRRIRETDAPPAVPSTPQELADGTTQLLERRDDESQTEVPEARPEPSSHAEASAAEPPTLPTLPALPTRPDPEPPSRPEVEIPAVPPPDAGHPASFAEPEPEPRPPETRPPETPASATPASATPPSETPKTPPPQSPKTPASVDELGFGGAAAPAFAERPRGRSRRRGGKGRKRSSGAGARRRGNLGGKGSGTGVLVGAALAAVLVFAIGYAFAAGVDLRQLVGLGGDETVVPPSDLPPVAVDPGYLVLDAEPWAEIVQITDGLGEEVPLRFRHTPARYELPPGSYTVVMTPPDGESQTLEVEVTTGETTSVRPELVALDVDDYFRFMGWSP